MRTLSKWLGLLLVPVVIAGAAYGYYWYQVKVSVDRLAESMAPFARLSYSRVVAGLDGSAGVSGVALVPAGSQDSVRIESVLLRAPDPLFYLNAEKNLRDGQWPGHLALDISGLELALNADFLTRWESLAQSMEAQTGAPAGSGVSFDALGCGDVERFDLSTTRTMGYRSLKMDALVAMDFMPRPQKLRLSSDVSIEGMAQTGIKIELSTGTSELSAGSLAMAQPTLDRVTLDYSDLGYNPRRNNFCAKQVGMAPNDFPVHHGALVQAELKRLGWSVPDPLIKAYADVQRPQAILQVTAEPPPGFGAQSLDTLTSPEQLLDLFNLRVSVNGVRQDLSGIRWSLEDEEQVAAQEAQDGDAPQAETAEGGSQEPGPDLVVDLEPPKAVEPQQQEVVINDPDVVQVMPGIVVKAREAEKTYKPTAVTQAHAYSGQPVKLRTYFGRRIEGTLVKVHNGTLEVEQRMDRGVAIFPIATDKVAELSIYR
ncbi:hypothetical protein [Marinobacterium aestuariivivens]|uniref:Uncharacterized protein n=1 Tax=Marinobacterium aestuariivivens TaxID=1698799 RepID=A0ABW1ZY62_9GAMM